jgi:hypothetical protein
LSAINICIQPVTLGTTYIATAKWSVFYDELEYICTFNGINYDEIPEPEQGELI